MIPHRRLIAPVVCVALICSASLVMADAGSPGSVTIAPQRVASAISTCPRGTGVVAGGFRSPGFNPANNGAAAVRIASRRLGRRKLKTTGFNFGQQPGRLLSRAYCSKLGNSIKLASEKVFLAAQSPGVAVATCRGDREAIAGGFASPGFSPNGPQIVTLTSKRVGRSEWRVEAFNLNNDDGGSSPQGQPGTLVAYAYCVEHAPPIVVRDRRVAAGVMGAPKTVRVDCPRGMSALSGGFDGNIQLSANSTGSGAIESRRAGHGRSWLLSVISISERTARATGFAYCVPRRG